MGDGPYAAAAWVYRRAGWTGVLPLPAGAKWPPPARFTGWTGVEPSGADVQAWCDGSEGAGNIALRLPADMYGLDVDAYGGKRGGAALAQLVERLGPLPPTWRVTSRDDGTSGIRLYRAVLPPGRRWRDEPGGHGAGIEAIHRGHRYAVTWPSTHPETGREYVWYRPDDATATDGEVPRPGALPELPAEWIEALSEPGEVRTGDMAGHAETLELVTGWRDGEACTRVARAQDHGLARLREARDGAALHPAARDAVHELTNLGHEGHAGVRAALAEHYSRFVQVRSGDRGEDRRKAEGEWWRLVRGAVGKLRSDAARDACDCALRSGAGLLIEYEPPVTLEVAPAAATGLGATPAETDLRTRMLARVYDRDRLDDIQPPTPLIDGVLDVATLAMLAGKFGTYKTFVSVGWALSVATGVPWFGRDVMTVGPVLYVATEGASGLRQRVRAWEVANLDGARVPADRFIVYNGVVSLANATQVDILAEVAARSKPVMIVFDTLHKCIPGLDEQGSTDMSQPLHRANQLREGLGAAVVFDHHTGHDGERSRGSSALEDDIDTSWVIKLSGDQEDRSPENQRVLTHRKAKDRDLLEDVPLLLRPIDGTGSCVVEPAEADPRPGVGWLVTAMLAAKLDELGAPRRLTIKETKRYGEKAGLGRHSQSMWAGIARVRREPLPTAETSDDDE